METLFGLLIIIFFVVALWRFPRFRALIQDLLERIATGEDESHKERLPYRSQGFLLTRNEAAFFHSLRKAVGDRYVISMKVRMSDVLKCSRQGWRDGYGNKIVQKHLDFVLCDPNTLRIAAAIEVDDSSHQRADRAARDEFVDAAMRSAGVPLIRFAASRQYIVSDIANTIRANTESTPDNSLHTISKTF